MTTLTQREVAPATWIASLGATPDPSPKTTRVMRVAGQDLSVTTFSPQQRLSSEAKAECGVIFDGWLYNRKALLSEFGDLLPPTISDAALVLEAYLRWGEGVLHKLEGAYALCIRDGRNDLFLCARDRLGVYPLFYLRSNQGWHVSTAVETLLQHPLAPKTINRGALVAYLFQRFRDTEETFFNGLQRLLPGYLLKVKGSAEATISRYWSPLPPGPVNWKREEDLEGFAEAMKQSIGRCLQLGHAGIYLSGGLDSGTIATLATDYCQEQNLPLPHALSLVYQDEEANEEHTQKGLAEALGLAQTLFPVDRTFETKDLVLDSLELNRSWPHPLMAGLAPLHLSYGKKAKQGGCDLVMWGEGGDEWLVIHELLAADFIRGFDSAGLRQLYHATRATSEAPWYKAASDIFWTNGLKQLLLPRASSLLGRMNPGLLQTRRKQRLERDLPAWLAPDPALKKDIFERAEKNAQPLQGTFYEYEVSDLLDHPLTSYYKEDNFESGRRVNVPLLEPFYDPAVINFLAHTPPHLRTRGGRHKGLLRHFLHQRFPQLGYDQQIKPYLTNFAAVRVFERTRQLWPTIKRSSALVKLGIVDAAHIDRFVTEILEGESAFDVKPLWLLLCAEFWVQSRLDTGLEV